MSGGCKTEIKFLVILVLTLLTPVDAFTFGFAGHRKINRMAVFTLPPEMIGFYKANIEYITERSVDPDKRSHVVPGEAPRHWIDIEMFGDIPFDSIPRQWDRAIAVYTEDTLVRYGILPWHVELMLYRLTKAFENQDLEQILYLSAHTGHYIADLCTPLHTTKYYNGKIPSHQGIHAFWETRIVEKFAETYNYMVGRAQYIDSPQSEIWNLLYQSHQQVDNIYNVFDLLLNTFPHDQLYIYEMRGQSLTRNFSGEFSTVFHEKLDGMVESQMRQAVKAVGDFWYTAWVNSGQPDLYALELKSIREPNQKILKRKSKTIQRQLINYERPTPE